MFFGIVLFSLLGCPLPPEESDTPKIPTLNQGAGNNQGGNNQNSGGAKAGGGAGTPPSGGPPSGAPSGVTGDGEKPKGGPGGVLLDMSQMKAQKSQEEMATQDHVTISGEIGGDCTGDIRLDVIATENMGAPKEGEGLQGPITSIYLEKPGAFSVLAPKSASVNLTALCDTDKNQKITADVDMLSLGVRLGVVDEDVADVSLTLEAIKPPSGDQPPKPKE